MIPVEPKPEPDHFDERVRQPGLRFLGTVDAPIQWKHREYWRRILSDLYEAYDGICAYSAHWIPRDTGTSTVDHFTPKSSDPQLAYEWNNYRLASLKMNARKGEYQDVLDPFQVEAEWFILDFPSMQVKANRNLSNEQQRQVDATIRRLNLNHEDSVQARFDWLLPYCNEDISFEHLQEKAPFIAFELERQDLRQDIKEIIQPIG